MRLFENPSTIAETKSGYPNPIESRRRKKSPGRSPSKTVIFLTHCSPVSVTRFGEIPQLWQIIKNIRNIFKVYLVLGNVFNSSLHKLNGIGHIFIAENGQILKTQFGHLVTLQSPYNRQQRRRRRRQRLCRLSVALCRMEVKKQKME